MPTDLELAILAMDAYNRRGAGLDLQGARLGRFMLSDKRSDLPNISFFAQAYTAGDDVIISYRGTDSILGDLLNGWAQGGGYLTPQAEAAAKFYQEVTGQEASTTGVQGRANVTLTGHSLGGGLAGFLAKLYGTEAVVFDNMGFSASAEGLRHDATTQEMSQIPGQQSLRVDEERDEHLLATYYGGLDQPAVPPLYGDNYIRGFATTGEFLTANRGNAVTYLDSFGDNLRDPFFDLHSMSLLVLLMYAQQESKTDWSVVGSELFDALFDDSLATVVGFENNDDGLRSAIGYSALTGGENLPFGDTAIRSYFDDADELGRAVSSGGGLTDFQRETLAKVIVQFAGHLAKQKVLASSNADAVNGILDRNSETLAVDFSDRLWSFGQSEIVGRDALTAAALLPVAADGDVGEAPHDADAMQWLWGASDTDVIDRLIFSATSDGIVAVIEDRQVPTAGATLFVGTGGSDSVIGSSHNDLIVGHGGDDTIDGRDGDDYLRRGAGSDRLIGGTGKNYLARPDFRASPLSITLARSRTTQAGRSERERLM